jgi:hypothetical protein
MSVFVGIDVHRKRSQVAVVTKMASAAERERGQGVGADAVAAGRSAGRVRLGLAGCSCWRGLRLRRAPGAPAAVQGDRLGGQ